MELELQLKQLIIDSLALEDIGVEDIDTDAPLFGDEGLGLDSVDALELGLAVQKRLVYNWIANNKTCVIILKVWRL